MFTVCLRMTYLRAKAQQMTLEKEPTAHEPATATSYTAATAPETGAQQIPVVSPVVAKRSGILQAKLVCAFCGTEAPMPKESEAMPGISRPTSWSMISSPRCATWGGDQAGWARATG